MTNKITQTFIARRHFFEQHQNKNNENLPLLSTVDVDAEAPGVFCLVARKHECHHSDIKAHGKKFKSKQRL